MKSILRRTLWILPFLFVFIASVYLPTDPDLGWHLKYGEYFSQHHQLLKDNTFSTMMPAYHWVNGTWGTDVITFALYKIGGFFAISLAGASIVTLTFFFLTKAGRLDFLSAAFLFPLFIFLLSPANANAFRGQQLSYLFLAVLLFLISNYKPLTKKFFFIPLLFLLWCNIHEEAFLFLTLFGAWVGFVLIKISLARKYLNKDSHKKEDLFLLGIFLLSFLVTFINPFGPALLGNALSYFGNNLVTRISEYEPYTALSPNWWGQITVGILLIVYIINAFRKKRFDKNFPVAVMTAVILLLGFSMRRYLWPAYYMTLTFITIPSVIMKTFRGKYAPILGTIFSLVTIIIVIQYKLPLSQFTIMSWDEYCSLQAVPCSLQSAQFLQNHHVTGKLFSYYDWGGWLIWNYPSIKPSIDGRMTEWKDTHGYSATADYETYINDAKSIDSSSYDIVYLPNDTSPLAMELTALVQQKKWNVVYEDDKAGIVVRNSKK